jgi:Mlc titration factor MtfA (ptsG expression regulator)
MFHRRHGLPDDWYDIVDRGVGQWATFDTDERERLESSSDWLLRHKHWEAANGFALDDEIVVTVAFLASIVVLGLSVDDFAEVSAIIVYPTAMVSRGVYAGPAAGTVTDGALPILGQAHDRRGPVLLAWDQAQAAARNPGTGSNVVFHEFAHKLDMLDHLVDGTPPLPHREDVQRWVEVCTEVFNDLRAGNDRSPVGAYGATNPAEFFAVATEAFFDVPTVLQANEPNLYDVLRDYYKQDPAARARRPLGRGQSL